jgi:hypothetical protein
MNIPQPSIADIRAAQRMFRKHEPRDLFYRAATELVKFASQRRAKLTLAEALSVLLQTWNQVHYRFHPFNQAHFSAIDSLLRRHLYGVRRFRGRTISSLVETDRERVVSSFTKFEHVLGAVGAAKSLHLLAPRFFPLWDRKIAQRYGCPVQQRGTNAAG